MRKCGLYYGVLSCWWLNVITSMYYTQNIIAKFQQYPPYQEHQMQARHEKICDF